MPHCRYEVSGGWQSHRFSEALAETGSSVHPQGSGIRQLCSLVVVRWCWR